jgi:hypothetical protein
VKLFTIGMCILYVCVGHARSQEAILAIEDACANTGDTHVFSITLDNSSVSDVAAGEMSFNSNETVFTVVSVEKTSRSQSLDIFSYNNVSKGIILVFVGISHSIAPGTGPIADVTVQVAAWATSGAYEWILSGTILSDPLQAVIPHTNVSGWFGIPCGVGVQPTNEIALPADFILSRNSPTFAPAIWPAVSISAGSKQTILCSPEIWCS